MKCKLCLAGMVLTFSSFATLGQANYKIDFKIKNLKDSVAYLGYYFWESSFVKDTARVSPGGSFSFAGREQLGEGIYLLIVKRPEGNIKLFEFVVGSDQSFAIETSYENLIDDIKITGDLDNKLFFESLKHKKERFTEAEPFMKVLRDTSTSLENKAAARERFAAVSIKVKRYQNELIRKNPNTITARILKASQEIEVPKPPLLANGRVDSSFQFRYFKKHYWDNFDLADDALLRLQSPLFKEKLKYYLEKLVIPDADSLNKEIDQLAQVARKNKEMYKYLIWKCVGEYQHHPIMGLDAVYVHLYDKYFASREMDYWIDEKTKGNMKEVADQFRRSLIGQTAPNLIMQDQNLKPRNMYDIKSKYTILFIFDPDCGHCREETPKLVSFYNAHKRKFDVEVFAVSADTSIQKMKNYIKEMGMVWITVNGPRSYVGSYQRLYDANQTPSLYIIDSKKKIIAKKPPIEKLEEFLTHYEESLKKKGLMH